jgi:hypothetical protein
MDPDNPEKYSRIRQISSKYNKLEAILNYWTGIMRGRG